MPNVKIQSSQQGMAVSEQKMLWNFRWWERVCCQKMLTSSELDVHALSELVCIFQGVFSADNAKTDVEWMLQRS